MTTPTPAIRRMPAALALVLATALPAVAQAPHLVGPGGFAQIGDAVAAAQPGDLIVVQQGTYLPFDVPIGVRIVAPAGATVSPPIGAQFPVAIAVPPGQRASFVGLSWRTVTSYPPAIWPLAMQVQGHAVFQNCRFECPNADYDGTPTTCNGDVQFDRCIWTALDDCLEVAGGHVQLNDCNLAASWTSYNHGPAHAVVATGGVLEIFSSGLQGAAGDDLVSCPGSSAIVLSGNARLRITDSLAIAGTSWFLSCSPGVSAIENNTANPVLHARSTLTGSQGQVGFPPVLVQAPPITGPEQQEPLVGGIGPGSGPASGFAYSATVFGPLNAFVAVGLSFDRAPATTIPFFATPVHFDLATVIVYQTGLLTTPLAAWPGFGSFDTQTPPLPAAGLGLELWLHPITWDGAALRAGPTLGGVLR
ncbi:MAG: hypothetical protein H6835_04785 [Planctomycetes bacterium]|nr:hypothetical protein [Planctomycetota bacterium]